MKNGVSAMMRTIVMGIVMAFALGFVGCRSCLAPYDHCQPTFVPERGDQCMGELYRCGSTLGGAEQTSTANGECEDCGGGQIEYYSPNGLEVEGASLTSTAQAASQSVAQASYVSQALGPYSAPSETYPDFSANAGNYDFNLRDDSAEYEARRPIR